MDDSGSPHDFDAWQAVAASGTVLEQVEAEKSRTPAVLERWRAAFGAESVRIALELCEARRRLVLKWPEASGWIADRSGAEQASSALAARYKAQQLIDRGVTRVTDLMCGIGGDTAALHQADLEVQAIDHDPFRVRCAAHNETNDLVCFVGMISTEPTIFVDPVPEHSEINETNDSRWFRCVAQRNQRFRWFR